MQLTRSLLIIFGLLVVFSCAPIPPAEYMPDHRRGYVTASWYGEKFHGRPTSSGERYDMYGYTAAHKTLKFGTRLRVTNPDNNRSVVVTVNDRGPFIPGRDLDLSYGAARKIGLTDKGVGRVKIEKLGRDMRYVKRAPFIPNETSGYVTIQVGSFTEDSNAGRLKKGLEMAYTNVYITTVHLDGQKFYRVRIGKFTDIENAHSVAERLADEGYSIMITSQAE